MEFKLATEIGPDLIPKWEAFVLSQKTGSLLQLPLWKDLFDSKTQGWLFFWGQEQAQIRIAALIRVRKILGLGVDCSIERGPVCDDETLLMEGIKQLLILLKKEKAIGLRLNPYWEFPIGERIESGLKELGFEPFQRKNDRHFETLTIALGQSTEEIFKRFRKTTRYEIKKARNLGSSVKIAEDESELWDFFRVFKTMSQKKQIKVPTYYYFQKLWDLVLKKQDLGILLLSYFRDQLISGVIILKHGERAVYSWGASVNGDQGKISKTHLAMWEGIIWAKGNGCRLFDMGGYTGGQGSSSVTENIDLFKKGFGGEFCRLVKIHRYIFQKNKEKWLRPFLS